MSQLGFFGSGDDNGDRPAEPIEPIITEEDHEAAAHLPSFLRFGTCSWSFPGWTDIVWKGTPSETALARHGLTAYAQHPLLRAVSLDRSYYGPVRAEELATYAAQLDEAAKVTPNLPPFRVVSKVWDEITTAVFPKHPRYGARAGTVNPSFLDADRFLGDVLEPYRTSFQGYTGPFVFELTPMPHGALDEKTLAAKAETFLSRMPSGFDWAFELRNAELLGPRWLDVLRAHDAAHVFNFWTAMPSLRVQLGRGTVPSRLIVLRLMLPPFTKYASKKDEYAPFNRIALAQPEMRDDVVHVLRAAAEAGCDEGFVLVNNKAEGSAPLTIKALAKLVGSAFR